MSFPRATMVVLALSVVYVGFEECRLRLHCSSPRELPLDALDRVDGDGPVWVRARITLHPGEPETVAAGPGSRRLWIPYHREDTPGIVAAILELPDSEEARGLLDRLDEAPVEGLARYPGQRDRAPLDDLLESRGADCVAGVRIVEVGRSPRTWTPAIVTLLSGAIAAILAIAGLGRIAPELIASTRAGREARRPLALSTPEVPVSTPETRTS